MTYLPNHIFKNILAYCDDRIEREQRLRISNLNKTIVNMNNLQNIMIETSNSSLSRNEKEAIVDDILIEMERCFEGDSMDWNFELLPFRRGPSHFLINGTGPFYNDDSFNHLEVFGW